jgi:hypothetical protein
MPRPYRRGTIDLAHARVRECIWTGTPERGVLHARAGQPGQCERRESATDVRLDGDEMAADADAGLPPRPGAAHRVGQLVECDAGHASGTYMVADFVPYSNAKDAVVADPDQPVISASPPSAQRVIPPVPFTAVGCAVRWLAECRPDPRNCERDHDEDRDDNFAPHVATITTAEGPMVTAVWQFGLSAA